jgi:hypothetical protein
MTSLPETIGTAHAVSPGRETGRAAVRYIVFHPLAVVLLAFALLFGGWLGGMVGVTLAAVLAVGLTGTAARSRALRTWAGRHVALEERRRRTFQRARRLEAAAAERTRQFAELSRMVEQIEDDDSAVESTRLELQDLLDRYIDLAVAHARYVDASRRADLRMVSVFGEDFALGDAATRKLRQELLARRAQHKDECRRRALELESELESIVEFLQLVDQKAACPVFDLELEEEVQRRLGELDTLEQAHRQLLSPPRVQ